MNEVEARLDCLRLAKDWATSRPAIQVDAEEIQKIAEKWAKFVLGPNVVESKSGGRRGADDHLADKKIAPLPGGQ